MKTVTKFGLLIALLTNLTLLSACGSKNKNEDTAEQAAIEKTQEIMAETSTQKDGEVTNDTEDITDSSNLGASSSGLGH
jgi:hypothetical protein